MAPHHSRYIIIISQCKTRFSFTNHLRASKLLSYRANHEEEKEVTPRSQPTNGQLMREFVIGFQAKSSKLV